jgi:hypothetical protein
MNYGGIIITQEDLDKAKIDLTKEIKALKKKYSFLHNHEIKSIILQEFFSGKNPRKDWIGEKKTKLKTDGSLA